MYRLWREENLSEISQHSSAVVVSFGVVWRRVAQIVRCYSWVAVLTDVTSSFIPLVGGLVDDSQVGMEEGVTRKQEEDKDQKSQHEYDSREGQEEMLGWRRKTDN